MVSSARRDIREGKAPDLVQALARAFRADRVRRTGSAPAMGDRTVRQTAALRVALPSISPLRMPSAPEG